MTVGRDPQTGTSRAATTAFPPTADYEAVQLGAGSASRSCMDEWEHRW